MSNPLLDNFNTPFGSAPFELIKNEHFKPAFEKAIEWAKDEINEICKNPEIPTFKNTIEAMELSGEKLSRISASFNNYTP